MPSPKSLIKCQVLCKAIWYSLPFYILKTKFWVENLHPGAKNEKLDFLVGVLGVSGKKKGNR